MRRREAIAGLAFAATSWPLTAPAQQAGRLKRVGVLHPGPHAVLNTQGWRAFESGLREEGFLEGRDFEFEHRFAEDLGHLSSGAAELVEANVAVILVRAGSDASSEARDGDNSNCHGRLEHRSGW